MQRRLLAAALFAAVLSIDTTVAGSPSKSAAPAPVVVLTTVKGVIEIETFPSDAPKSVARFVELAKQGFYRGNRFHWVQPSVAQVGDLFSRDMTKRHLWGTGGSGPQMSSRPIGVAEFSAHKFERGVVGLAYQNGYKPETADCQIFILKVASPTMNGKYAAIGRVITGMAVVDKIELDDMIKDVRVR